MATELESYFKIEVYQYGSQWRRASYLGRLSRFSTLEQAGEALKDNRWFPNSLHYRIVKVTEEVVHDQPKEKPLLV